MGRFFILAVAVILVCGAAHAEQVVNFTNYASWGETLQGVDGNTSSWSSNNSTVKLKKSSWSLLNGKASVFGYRGFSERSLSHRGTRGLGVWGNEKDEIDSYGHYPEKIEITFNNMPYWLNSLEIRSLFYEPNLWTPGTEEGHVDFYLSGDKVGEQHFVGWEDIRTSGTKGINSFTATPPAVDKLVFYVQASLIQEEVNLLWQN